MAAVPILQLLRGNGGLVDSDVEAVARICDVDRSDVQRLVDEYPEIGVDPMKGPAVCGGLVCWIRGTLQRPDWIQHAGELLGVGNRENLEMVGCIGCCYAAPIAIGRRGEFYTISFE